jgi:toxin YoeB
MLRLTWTETALEDLDWWARHDPRKLKRIIQLCLGTCENPTRGIGKPEPLRFDYAGYWSRRIDQNIGWSTDLMMGKSRSFNVATITNVEDCRVEDMERELGILRRWQSARLAHTHADLLHSPRYQPAADFFLNELYGDRDFRQREQDEALHHFLESGFHAFWHMGADADAFVATVTQRERAMSHIKINRPHDLTVDRGQGDRGDPRHPTDRPL